MKTITGRPGRRSITPIAQPYHARPDATFGIVRTVWLDPGGPTKTVKW